VRVEAAGTLLAISFRFFFSIFFLMEFYSNVGQSDVTCLVSTYLPSKKFIKIRTLLFAYSNFAQTYAGCDLNVPF